MQPTDTERLTGRARAAQQRREAALCEPDRVVNTAVLDVALRALGWSRGGNDRGYSRLARELGMNRTHVYNVVNGRVPAEPAVRYKLAQLLPAFEPYELFIQPESPERDAGSAA